MISAFVEELRPSLHPCKRRPRFLFRLFLLLIRFWRDHPASDDAASWLSAQSPVPVLRFSRFLERALTQPSPNIATAIANYSGTAGTKFRAKAPASGDGDPLVRHA